MSADHAIEFEDAVFNGSDSACGFAREDVESCTQASLLDGLHERRLVDHFRTRSIDEIRTRLHRIEKLSVDQLFCVVVQRNVDADDIVYIPEHNGGLVSVLTLEGERLAQWGDPSFRSCHGIWGDSRGDLYVVRPGAWGPPRRVVKYVRLN